MSKCKVVLARHGVTDWNLERRYIGHADMPLNDIGMKQAIELGRNLASFDFDAIYSSDLRRAHETASIVRDTIQNLKRQPFHFFTDERLREMDFGAIEGMTYEEGMAHFPSQMMQWYERIEEVAPPGGIESVQQVFQRMNAVMKEINSQGYRRVLIVSHLGAIRSWLSSKGKKSFWEVSLMHGEWFEQEAY